MNTKNESEILKQFPQIEFSYETTTHKKIPSYYSICLAIPHAKKCVVWFTFYEGSNKCVLLEMNRTKSFSKVTILKTSLLLCPLYMGTILYGSLITNHETDNAIFVIEDVLMYEGVNLHKMVFGEKLGVIEMFLKEQLIAHENKPPISFYLPILWKSHINENETTRPPLDLISYPLHHIQYRSLTLIVPFLNVIPGNDGNVIPLETRQTILSNSSSTQIKTLSRQNKKNYCRNEQIKYKTTFLVKADSQTDVYNLYAYDENRILTLYDVAYIPNCKSSVYMNSLFRNIKENDNIDLIEESDDEDDFEDTREDKYVDTKAEIVMDCVYHTKFRRWVPIKVIYGGFLKIVSLTILPVL